MAQPKIYPSNDSSPASDFGLSPTEFTTLRTSATQAKALAYCPYSRFRVGATFLTSSSDFIEGANVENASYPVGTCAERVALAKAVVEGHTEGFRAVGVSTDISPPASPCGMCRQFMREFVPLECPIFMFDKDGNYVVLKLEQLLPMSFGPDQLPQPGEAGAQGAGL
ncbi:cytidine deaminase-like protein [Emericellopsis atlantica]|uniref:Cytidine deaminase n=1 Tax=Emericellopsis atlantica TaxID=2614577 RepID=A0A9P7ZU79_9HYPO|nr:cytidine deaminase-like protein [Emericellopsis atlantica]KAG9257916.1 cytidine deaminase-like protein [Emericellopsis atlantica]